jgi:hypothetical protein
MSVMVVGMSLTRMSVNALVHVIMITMIIHQVIALQVEVAMVRSSVCAVSGCHLMPSSVGLVGTIFISHL